MWNGHTIRAQKNRPHVVAGIPRDNYGGRDTARKVNCLVPVDQAALAKLGEALDHDRDNVSAHLPADMMILCDAMMARLDQDAIPPDPEGKELTWIWQYRHLRASLQQHEDQQLTPLLRLAAKPTGGWPGLDAIIRETGRSLEEILGEEIPDNFDPGLDR